MRVFRIPQSPFRNRPKAVTLVELLVAIAIISILATLLLGVGAVVGEVAREARTKGLIARLHTLVMERYDAYRNRRVELVDYTNDNDLRALLADFAGFQNIPTDDGRVRALTRLAAQREQMKFEMPDRWSDVLGMTLPASVPSTGCTPAAPARLLSDEPTLRAVYYRAYCEIEARNNAITGVRNTIDEIVTNQGAELLYLIVINSTGDGEARGLFTENEVGDTDGDGALEFIDGWGNPITFLRWAPGFDSSAQLNTAELARIERANEGNLIPIIDAIADDHDPLDLFRLDQPTEATVTTFEAEPDANEDARGWRLMPLILSAGGDEEYGIELAPTNVTAFDPYYGRTAPYLLGQRLTGDEAEAYADNIHNHAVGTLSQK
ncbi:MAG: prepilin-type N-terminal cleavage/methylation domain-containing protein [Planctomycetota bacterium]